MKSYLKYRALVYDPTANRQWESVNSPAEERLLLTRPGSIYFFNFFPLFSPKTLGFKKYRTKQH
jgi:hypothetical protein